MASVQAKSGVAYFHLIKNDDKDRKNFNFLHNWDINDQWSTNLEYRYASDKDYFADLDNSPNSKTDVNLRRAWELNYQHGIPGLKAQLKVEDFQTLDPTILDANKPYARLPQLLYVIHPTGITIRI